MPNDYEYWTRFALYPVSTVFHNKLNLIKPIALFRGQNHQEHIFKAARIIPMAVAWPVKIAVSVVLIVAVALFFLVSFVWLLSLAITYVCSYWIVIGAVWLCDIFLRYFSFLL